MEDDGQGRLFRIGSVARLTGVPVDVIRIWERRYKVVEPDRDPHGNRLYSDADVARLRRIRSATEAGHSVGRVAKMSDDQLERLMEAPPPAGQSVAEGAVGRILDAVRRGEAASVEQALASASMLLDARTLCLDVLAPVLRQAGDMWEEGSLSVWQEHLLSWLVRNVAGSLMRSLPRNSAGALMFATPPFEQHEFGIAIAAMLAAARGRPTHNLGVNVPASEVVEAARRLRPVCVVIGMTRSTGVEEHARAFAQLLERQLPRKTIVWFGGPLGATLAESIASSRVEGIATLEDFDRRLAVFGD